MPTPAETIEDVFRLLGVEGPEDGATVVLGALDEQGHIIVSAEDLRVMLGHWRRPATNVLGGQDAYDRLAALDSQSPTVEPETTEEET